MSVDIVEENKQDIEKLYSLEMREQLVENLIEAEHNLKHRVSDEKGMIPTEEMVKNIYNVIDKIFLELLRRLQWREADSLDAWDFRPMDILENTFPNIEKTDWYKMRYLQLLSRFKSGEDHE